MGSEWGMAAVLAFFFLTFWANPFLALWMLFTDTARGYAVKPGFKRPCWIVALLSSAVYAGMLLAGRFWWELRLPDFAFSGLSLSEFVLCFSPITSPLLCLCLGTIYFRRLRPSDFNDADIARLLRLGIWGGHGLITVPMFWIIRT